MLLTPAHLSRLRRRLGLPPVVRLNLGTGRATVWHERARRHALRVITDVEAGRLPHTPATVVWAMDTLGIRLMPSEELRLSGDLPDGAALSPAEQAIALQLMQPTLDEARP